MPFKIRYVYSPFKRLGLCVAAGRLEAGLSMLLWIDEDGEIVVDNDDDDDDGNDGVSGIGPPLIVNGTL